MGTPMVDCRFQVKQLTFGDYDYQVLTAVGASVTAVISSTPPPPKNHYRLPAGNLYVVITATDTPFCDEYLQSGGPLGPAADLTW